MAAAKGAGRPRGHPRQSKHQERAPKGKEEVVFEGAEAVGLVSNAEKDWTVTRATEEDKNRRNTPIRRGILMRTDQQIFLSFRCSCVARYSSLVVSLALINSHGGASLIQRQAKLIIFLIGAAIKERGGEEGKSLRTEDKSVSPPSICVEHLLLLVFVQMNGEDQHASSSSSA